MDSDFDFSNNLPFVFEVTGKFWIPIITMSGSFADIIYFSLFFSTINFHKIWFMRNIWNDLFEIEDFILVCRNKFWMVISKNGRIYSDITHAQSLFVHMEHLSIKQFNMCFPYLMSDFIFTSYRMGYSFFDSFIFYLSS